MLVSFKPCIQPGIKLFHFAAQHGTCENCTYWCILLAGGELGTHPYLSCSVQQGADWQEVSSGELKSQVEPIGG